MLAIIFCFYQYAALFGKLCINTPEAFHMRPGLGHDEQKALYQLLINLDPLPCSLLHLESRMVEKRLPKNQSLLSHFGVK